MNLNNTTLRSLIAILILITSISVSAQDSDTFEILHKPDTFLLDFRIDPLNNLWYIYEDKIIRFSDDIHYTDTFTSSILSDETSIDLKLPLKSLFYNPYINEVQIINSRWGVLNRISMDEIGLFNPKFVNFGYDEYIWTLDENSNQIIKFNDQGKIVFQDKNPFEFEGESYYPNLFYDFNYYAIIVDVNFGLFVIDNYGNLLKTKKLEKIDHTFQYGNTVVITFKDSTYVGLSYSLKSNTIDEKSLDLPHNLMSAMPYNKNSLFFLSDGMVKKIPYRIDK